MRADPTDPTLVWSVRPVEVMESSRSHSGQHGGEDPAGTYSLIVLAFCASIAVLVSCSRASAQRWETGPEPREGACFYRDTYFHGPSFCGEAGQGFETMPSSANDRVSSIRLYGGAAVTLYKRSHFRGDSRQFHVNVTNLGREDFNDRISSVQIELSDGSRGRAREAFGEDPEAIVRRAYQDILERDPDPAGMRLYRSHLTDNGWTEQQLRIDLRLGPEYRERNTMTPMKAEEMVRRVYLAVLKREPDQGSRGYVNSVLRDGWTQPDVEHELRQSPEYRGKYR